ncbi:Uncharacterised protein [Pseudomonas fluorescens]|uniref:Uncharacterized protein n=1 Tax=Pseudomonas fluorescens TaxID=294 RepID=A0A3S4T0D9_PSEFL|nr:Uncharacterised protein [Pseudomonas fluorescens]
MRETGVLLSGVTERDCATVGYILRVASTHIGAIAPMQCIASLVNTTVEDHSAYGSFFINLAPFSFTDSYQGRPGFHL